MSDEEKPPMRDLIGSCFINYVLTFENAGIIPKDSDENETESS